MGSVKHSILVTTHPVSSTFVNIMKYINNDAKVKRYLSITVSGNIPRDYLCGVHLGYLIYFLIATAFPHCLM
jgi:hypothetical protein